MAQCMLLTPTMLLWLCCRSWLAVTAPQSHRTFCACRPTGGSGSKPGRPTGLGRGWANPHQVQGPSMASRTGPAHCSRLATAAVTCSGVQRPSRARRSWAEASGGELGAGMGDTVCVMLCYTGISHGGCYSHMSSITAQTSSRDQCLDVASSP
jgi:hypothetical protein